MADRHDIAFIGVNGAAAALAGALIGLLIERRLLVPGDLDLLLDRARELAADPEPRSADVINLHEWPLKR